MQKIHIPFVSKCFFACEYFNHIKKNILLTFADEESTLKAYKHLQFLLGEIDDSNVLYFPSLDTLPYDRVSPNIEITTARANVLTSLSFNKSPKIIVTNAQNLIVKVPLPSIFKNSVITISPGDKVFIEEIAFFLVNNGFTRSSSAIDSGEFAIRGEIIDIVHSNKKGYRINFGWEVVESIKEFDVNSQISTKSLDKLELSSAMEAILNLDNIEIFRRNFLKNFGVNYVKHQMYESIVAGRKFQGYEHLLPLFYEEMANLTDYLFDHVIIYDNLSLQSIVELEKSYEDFYQSRKLSNKLNPSSFYFAITPDQLILSSDNLKKLLSLGSNFFIDSNFEEIDAVKENNAEFVVASDLQKIDLVREFELLPKIDWSSHDISLNNNDVADLPDSNKNNLLINLINNNKNKKIIICCGAKSSEQRIKNIIENQEYKTNNISFLTEAKKFAINTAITPLSHGFFTKEYLFISEQDILGEKFTSQSHKSTRRKLNNILIELDNIIEGELIVHKEHGIGRFEKIETIIVSDVPHDCLKIVYFNNDILYLPVENIDLIKKYGNEDAILDKLGSLNWQKRKARLKNRIKDIANELIKITAERELCRTQAVNFDPELYLNFCNRFIYSETEDQLSAIGDIEEDLKSGKLMDRLICGDVGFGKTEVAMRAAFMVGFDYEDDHPQVAIIAPTTILCRQHYMSFLERFKGLDICISQLSRLVTTTQAKIIKKDIEAGKINIIIGTHALLSKEIKFKNLKLLIIDEEQHFGVTQKERLKSLKSDVHVLSLSATPIPRTLQMSMSGLKDLSLIATPPIDRLPVRTTVMPFDGIIIRDTLMRERFRGGKSFYVVPRIKDIEWVAKKLLEYVPELEFKIAHGQMLPSELDNIMNEFCDGKFDILLSTTIIESGIDISSANTIIIHRADMLGLSQLYQLRGRVGRGKVRGYACLTLMSDTITTKYSLKRLEILQNIDTLGAGFTIASHDMDLRGFGNLIGDEQSGHIREIGSEMYQEMLDEAISELKNQQDKKESLGFSTSINLGLAVYIPANYIEDTSLRLAIYRRTANLKNRPEIETFRDEMIDRFGSIPEEFTNLLKIVEIKTSCQVLKIESLDSGPGGFVIKFNKNFDVSDVVMLFIQKFPRHAKIKPDNKLVFIKNLKNPVDILAEAEALLIELKDCVIK
jgi:transcription-repair coupling factor (superfamily II helicase)